MGATGADGDGGAGGGTINSYYLLFSLMKGTRQNPESYFRSEIPSANKLYHYTDARGLEGIAQNRILWMSNINYLNDSEEYYYTFDLTKKVLEKYYPGLLEYNKINFDRERVSNIFSFSLSEKEDLLSQWRGYCPNGGFAISLDVQQFNEIIKENDFKVIKCIYNPRWQEAFIIRHVIGFSPAEYMYEFEKERQEGTVGYAAGIYSSQMNNIWLRMNKAASILKHPSFSEEAEWRVIKDLNDSSISNESLIYSVEHHLMKIDSEKMLIREGQGDAETQNRLDKLISGSVKTRISRNILVPYIEIMLLNNSKKRVNISDLIVGPTPHKRIALEAARVFAKINTDCSVDVRSSDIPYVNW